MSNTFYGCISLQSVYIPKGVTLIGKDAFSNCNNLKTIYIDNVEGSVTFGEPWKPESTNVIWLKNS